MQLSLFAADDSIAEPTKPLAALLAGTLVVFDRLYDEQQEAPCKRVSLSFSGGKDSHALLGAYVYWVQATGKRLNLITVFSDTQLESPRLNETITRVERWCSEIGVEFKRLYGLRSYWTYLFGWGYPLPNWKLRWCTRSLKVQPVEKLRCTTLTGAHYGESTTRDRSLNTRSCGSAECGTDLLKGDRIDPIKEWRNCNVWDWIAEAEILHAALPPGTLNDLQEIYKVAQDENGSTRMGCEICPVIARSTLAEKVEKGISQPIGLKVRDICDQLINAPRLPSPKGGHGAILLSARVKVWQELMTLKDEMIAASLITEVDITHVESLLAAHTYPPSYTPEWVTANEPFAYTAQEAITRKTITPLETLLNAL